MMEIATRVARSAACLAALALLGQAEARTTFSYVTTPALSPGRPHRRHDHPDHRRLQRLGP